jgi:cell division protease FtsH
MILGKTTTGAANDFKEATDVAHKMVCQYGMSDLGPLTFGERDDLVFLGRDLTSHKNFSEHTSELIDAEVKKMIDRNFKRAKDILAKNKDTLVKIADMLLEREVLSASEIATLLKGDDLPKMKSPVEDSSNKKAPPSKDKKSTKPVKKPAAVNA